MYQSSICVLYLSYFVSYLYMYVDPPEKEAEPPSGIFRICIQLSRFELHLPTSSNGTDAICLLGMYMLIYICTYKWVSFILYMHVAIFIYLYIHIF
jgi:hypothetical protein